MGGGKFDHHVKVKVVITGLIGAFVDRKVETGGLDVPDRETDKHHAGERAEDTMGRSGIK
ncbi:hypothetical protein F1880_008772 [Penicillium rolfsii]|nr:hypothetical protein F1880_008772 [Penicillium rolfsii]